MFPPRLSTFQSVAMYFPAVPLGGVQVKLVAPPLSTKKAFIAAMVVYHLLSLHPI